ncbi:amidase, partial [Micromonospora globispora]
MDGTRDGSLTGVRRTAVGEARRQEDLVTEPAPPSGGEPPRPSAGPDAAESGARNPWAPPGAGFD